MAKKVLLCWFLVAVAAFGTAAPRHLLVPPAGQEIADFAQRNGLSVLETYESAVWVKGSIPSLRDRGVFVKTFDDWDLVRTVQPFRISQRENMRTATDAGLYILHFRAPLKAQWSAAVQALPGVTVVQALPYLSLVIHVAQAPVDLSAIPGVDWSGKLERQWRISPHVIKAPAETQGNANLILVNAPGIEQSLAMLAELGVKFQRPDKLATPWFVLRASGSREIVEQVAALEHVLWIEPRVEMEKHDERQSLCQAGLRTSTDPWSPDATDYKTWLTSKGLDSLSTVIVDVADDGWDTGDFTVGNHHPDFDDASGTTSRMLYQIDLCGDGGHGVGGHGTLNQAIVLGDGAGTGEVDPDGFSYGTGIAPTARGGQTKIFSDSGSFCPATMTEITAGSQTNGAQIASNSWGASTYGGYSADSAEYDLLVRDANNNSADGLQEFTIFFSAGNSGPSDTEIGSPGTAKNVITSGASENVRDHGEVDGCNNSNADNFQDINDFSSPGPCEDGRIKPDAMAPGNHVQAAASQYSGFTGASVCDQYWPAGQTMYAWSSGTSHSTPGMAGMGALIYEWYLAEKGAAPSPAMNKAIMLATSDDMAGGDDGNGGIIAAGPNTRQGWGLVNMGRVVDGTSYVAYDQEHVFTSSGQDHVPVPLFAVVDPSKPVRIMMTYTDAPGDPNATPTGGLGNDLDLVVTAGANVYYGNNFSGGFSQTGGTADAVNNLEGVFFPAGSVSTFEARIVASSIAADAIPGDGNAADQDFALYIYNATDQSSDGVVSLDMASYPCDGVLNIVASDEDLQGAGTQGVTVTSTTEMNPESVILNEDPAGSGFFSGSINLTGGAASAGDGFLSVAHADLITAYYSDLDDGSGGPNTKTATAVADCAAPVISNIQVVDIGSANARITWTTDEPASSEATWTTSVPPDSGSASSGGLVTAHSLTLNGLMDCTAHNFLVHSTDAVGADATSSPQQFTTAGGSAVTADSTDTPVSIPDSDETGVMSAVNVVSDYTVSDVNVLLNITHTYDGDLDIFLVGPDGTTTVELTSDNGDGNDNFVETVFDDEASQSITAGSAPFTGSFVPEQPLSAFDNMDAAGDWTLLVIDDAGSDLGTLDSWQLQLVVNSPCDSPLIFEDGFESGNTNAWSSIPP